MGSISSMGVALSGLKAAQAGLSTIGHNVANSSANGYTRQQGIQQNFSYMTIGSSPVGSLKMQVGLGTQVAVIRQIRNKFYDANYRQENSAGNFFSVKYTTGEEINNVIGELQSDYRAQDSINDIWKSINELIKDPGALETRSLFIQSSFTFLNKMKDINNKLFEYQVNLNERVKEQVEKINSNVEQIAILNTKIQEAETGGNRANDYRDARNLLLDELSGYLDIEVKETLIEGSFASRIDILVNGQELLVNNIPNKIGLKYTTGSYPFYEPVFTKSTEILGQNDPARSLFPNLANEDLSSNSDSSKGSLKSLLSSRGNVIGDYTMLANPPVPPATNQTNNFLIPKIQAKMDTLVHEVVTMLNNASTSGFGLLKDPVTGAPLRGEPIFVRKGGLPVGTPEDPNAYPTLFTLENLEINPDILGDGGYNRLGFSANGDIGDTTILTQLSNDWKNPIAALENSSIDGYYKKMIGNFAVEIKDAKERLQSKVGLIDLAENKRFSVSAVSLDEELSNMLKYQHAYNSAAKVINVIDSMLDKIINNMV